MVRYVSQIPRWQRPVSCCRARGERVFCCRADDLTHKLENLSSICIPGPPLAGREPVFCCRAGGEPVFCCRPNDLTHSLENQSCLPTSRSVGNCLTNLQDEIYQPVTRKRFSVIVILPLVFAMHRCIFYQNMRILGKEHDLDQWSQVYHINSVQITL